MYTSLFLVLKILNTVMYLDSYFYNKLYFYVKLLYVLFAQICIWLVCMLCVEYIILVDSDMCMSDLESWDVRIKD